MYKKPIIKPKLSDDQRKILDYMNDYGTSTLKSIEHLTWSHKQNKPINYQNKNFDKVQRVIGGQSSWLINPNNGLRFRDTINRYFEFHKSRNLIVILSEVTNKSDRNYGKFKVKEIIENKSTNVTYYSDISTARKAVHTKYIPLHLRHVANNVVHAGMKKYTIEPNRDYNGNKRDQNRGLYYIVSDNSFYDFDNLYDALQYCEFLNLQ